MSFKPAVNEEIVIEGVLYRIAEHPHATGMVYGQEGRQAVVYQLAAGTEQRALKVFKPRYRAPMLTSLAERLTPFAALPGLRVCRRTVLTASQHTALLRQYPELAYAVLMLWIPGPTWMEVLLDKQRRTVEQSLVLARALARVLTKMEEQGLAHCDLSGPNLLLPAPAAPALPTQKGATGLSFSAVELVDVAQLYGPEMCRPAVSLPDIAGYTAGAAAAATWEPRGDRFAGAALLAAILGWCDPQVRVAIWGVTYFAPGEPGPPAARFRALEAALPQPGVPARPACSSARGRPAPQAPNAPRTPRGWSVAFSAHDDLFATGSCDRIVRS